MLCSWTRHLLCLLVDVYTSTGELDTGVLASHVGHRELKYSKLLYTAENGDMFRLRPLCGMQMLPFFTSYNLFTQKNDIHIAMFIPRCM